MVGHPFGHKGDLNMTETEIKTKIKEQIEYLRDSRAFSTTCWVELCKTEYVTWAVVLGWVDGYETKDKDSDYVFSTLRICGKVASLRNNSVMSEYDIDWLMPADEDGEIIDTETSIESDADIDDAIKFWQKEWEEEVKARM